MRSRAPGRPVTGILLLDKPPGLTSNEALQRVKHYYRARKAGHTGSLDPLATGLLPCCLGDSTKFSAFLLDADKRYRVRIRLGINTTTGDAEGEVVATAPVDNLAEDQVRNLLARFVGPLDQRPPMYSAVKHRGERLYRLARQGIEVDRQPRRIHIYALTLVAFALPEIEIEVHCSKGTYVRTLAEDIGQALGCGAHVSALRRTGVGPYVEPQSTFIASEQLAMLAENGDLSALDALLRPLDSALEHYPALRLPPDAAFYLQQGQAVLVPRAPTEGWVRLYDPNARFIGVGEIGSDGRVQPRRLL